MYQASFPNWRNFLKKDNNGWTTAVTKTVNKNLIKLAIVSDNNDTTTTVTDDDASESMVIPHIMPPFLYLMNFI